jgi:hypothetical protein
MVVYIRRGGSAAPSPTVLASRVGFTRVQWYYDSSYSMRQFLGLLAAPSSSRSSCMCMHHIRIYDHCCQPRTCCILSKTSILNQFSQTSLQSRLSLPSLFFCFVNNCSLSYKKKEWVHETLSRQASCIGSYAQGLMLVIGWCCAEGRIQASSVRPLRPRALVDY